MAPLEAWITDPHVELQIDDNDPSGVREALQRPRPASRIIRSFRLRPEKPWADSWIAPGKRVAFRSRAWGRQVGVGDRKDSDSGAALFATRPFLTEFMTTTDRDLLLLIKLEHFRESERYNPDEVAKGLSPDSPEDVAYEAARVADTWRRDLAARGVSFCMETVFSDPQGAKLEFLKECQSIGYTVILVFIGLESAELSLGRVIQRVERGGHDVPDAKIEARFPRTFDNLRQALTFVDEALLFDNSSADKPFRFVAAFKAGKRSRRKGFAPAWAAMVE